MKDKLQKNSQDEVSPDLDNILSKDGKDLSKQDENKLVAMKQEIFKGPLPHLASLRDMKKLTQVLLTKL